MNPVHCPACGSHYLFWSYGRDKTVRFYACNCGTEWRTHVDGDHEIVDTIYPAATNLNSD